MMIGKYHLAFRLDADRLFVYVVESLKRICDADKTSDWDFGCVFVVDHCWNCPQGQLRWFPHLVVVSHVPYIV